MNQAEFSRYHGVSRKTVTKWKEQGLLVIKDGKVDLEASNERLLKHRDTVTQDHKKKDVTRPKTTSNGNKPRAARGNTSTRVPRPSGNTDGQRKKRPIVVNNGNRDSDSDFNGMIDENLLTFNDARTMKENYRALKEQLEYDTQAGTVLPFDEIIAAIRDEYARMRTRLIAIAPEHGPRLRTLASTSTDNEFVQEIQEVIHEALEELSLDTTEKREGGRQ